VNRRRLATVLAVLAGLMVLGTTAAAVASYLRRPIATASYDDPSVAVRDPHTGASYVVPAGWTVEDRQVRIWYADPAGRPAALVRGPAIYREGYCAARPSKSNRGFAGFTRQDFDTWASALARSAGLGRWRADASTVELTLSDGHTAVLRSAVLLDRRGGRCSAPGVAVSMVSTAVDGQPVRLVLVRDTAAEGTLSDREAVRILSTLRLPG
jgi:hypothetical protein